MCFGCELAALLPAQLLFWQNVKAGASLSEQCVAIITRESWPVRSCEAEIYLLYSC